MTLEEMYKIVAEWASSPEGQRELKATCESARAAAERVKRDAAVTPEQLRMPCTICRR